MDGLPAAVREKAQWSFRLWLDDQTHPGLHFEKVDDSRNIWSARVGLNHRAVCLKRRVDGEVRFVWFWIGEHDEYDRLING